MSARSIAWPVIFALLAIALACELTSELGVYTADHGETTAALDTDTSSDTGGTAETGTAGGESETSSGNGDGDEPGGLCTIDGSEDPCRVCVEYLCCDRLEGCDLESGCNCMVECLFESDPVTCAMTCTPGPAYFQLLQCQATNCAAVCQ